MKQVLGRIRRADQDFKLFRSGDRVMVGLSGGKDSMVLMTALATYRNFSDEPFTLCAGMVRMGFPDFDTTELEEYCRTIDVPLYFKDTRIGPIVFETRKESNPCALCAKMRRGSLNELAQRHGCNKVALGHHRDDLTETLLMSMLYESRLRTFSPITWLDRADIVQIRPMIYLPEAHIASVCRRLSLPTCKNPCPASGNTKRQEMKDLLAHLGTLCPDAHNHIFMAIKNTDQYGLWDAIKARPDEPANGELVKREEAN